MKQSEAMRAVGTLTQLYSDNNYNTPGVWYLNKQATVAVKLPKRDKLGASVQSRLKDPVMFTRSDLNMVSLLDRIEQGGLTLEIYTSFTHNMFSDDVYPKFFYDIPEAGVRFDLKWLEAVKRLYCADFRSAYYNLGDCLQWVFPTTPEQPKVAALKNVVTGEIVGAVAPRRI